MIWSGTIIYKTSILILYVHLRLSNWFCYVNFDLKCLW